MTHPKRPDQTWLEWKAEHDEAGGGTETGGTWSLVEGNDGKTYERNSKTGETRLAPPQFQSADPNSGLRKDLVDLGLVPLDAPDAYDQQQYDQAKDWANMGRSAGTAEIAGQQSYQETGSRSPYLTDEYGELYERDGTKITEAARKRLLGSASGGGSGDPYAGAQNARAERAQQEQIRQNRIAEAMNAIDLQTVRQKAALAGAQFAAPTDTGGYHAGMMPTSPAVRAGLVDPLKFTPVPYNANIGDAQIAKDLAMIRGAAGVR